MNKSNQKHSITVIETKCNGQLERKKNCPSRIDYSQVFQLGIESAGLQVPMFHSSNHHQQIELNMFDGVMDIVRWIYPLLLLWVRSFGRFSSTKLIKFCSTSSTTTSFSGVFHSSTDVGEASRFSFLFFFFFFFVPVPQSHRNEDFKARNALDSHSNNEAVQLNNTHFIVDIMTITTSMPIQRQRFVQ